MCLLMSQFQSEKFKEKKSHAGRKLELIFFLPLEIYLHTKWTIINKQNNLYIDQLSMCSLAALEHQQAAPCVCATY